MELKNIAMEYVNEADMLAAELKKKMGNAILDGDVESEDFELIVRLCGMFSLSTKLIKEQALAIQSMNEKLDKLLDK